MADYVTGVKTNQGEKKIDYNYLANKLKTKDGSEDGYLISAEDKAKLDAIENEANKIIVDSSLSDTSTNPVQNKVIKAAISNLSTQLDTKVDESTFNSTVSDLSSNIDSKAPTNHSSTATTYGIGTTSQYGHVKLSNNCSGTMVDPANGVAASTIAVNELAGTVNKLAGTDYVIAQGEWSSADNTIWRYRKWNTGIKECWCQYSRDGIVITSSTGVDGIFYSSERLYAKFPTNFFTDTVHTCIASFDGAYEEVSKNGIKTYYSVLPAFKNSGATITQTPEMFLYRIGSVAPPEEFTASGLTVVINFYAVGI